MRDIKFRYYDPFNDEMIYSGNFNSLAAFFNQYQIAVDGDNNPKLFQFTGLKDKNGRDVYEGDILKNDTKEILEVKFGELPLDKSGDCVCSYLAFYCKNYGKLGMEPMYKCEEIGNWMIVIGNIYENPSMVEM